MSFQARADNIDMQSLMDDAIVNYTYRYSQLLVLYNAPPT